VLLVSSFNGPPNGQFQVEFSVWADADQTQLAYEWIKQTGQVPQAQLTIGSSTDTATDHFGSYTLADGVNATVKVILSDNSGVLDQTVVQLPWHATTGLGSQAQALAVEHGSGGGLTTDQAQQLAEIHQSTFPSQLIDNITLFPLTNGPEAGPINSFLSDVCFGCIVRLASIPTPPEPQTPDGDYWLKTLAVVRVFRGSDLWLRVPVHTSNRMIPFQVNWLVASVDILTANNWLLNMSIQVTFLPGVTGEVFLMRFP